MAGASSAWRIVSLRPVLGISAALMVCVAAAGCGQQQPPAHALAASVHRAPVVSVITGPGAAHITSAARQAAISEARRLLARVVVPPGSRPVAALPGKQMASPAQSANCAPLIDGTLRWLVPGSPAAASAFLAHHVPAGFSAGSAVVGQQTLNGSKLYVVAFTASGHSGAQLVFGLAGDDHGAELRADVQVPPAGSGCVSSGGVGQ